RRPTLGPPPVPLLAVSHLPGLTSGEESCSRYSLPKRALQAPVSPTRLCPFCIQVVPFYSEELRLRVDSERGNRHLEGGRQPCGHWERGIVRGIPVAHPSVRSQTLPRPRVDVFRAVAQTVTRRWALSLHQQRSTQ